MTEEFTASNGLKVTERYDGERVYLYDTNGENLMKQWDFIGSRDTVALAEYYRAKEDERLGRWRWPENTDYVALPRERTDTPREKRRVRVIHEPSGDFMDTVEGSSLVGVFKDAARAYFDAHPEPKPWHDAAEGEVWEIEFKAGKHAWFVNGAYFQSTKTLTNIYKTDPDILSAHRIYPPAD